MHFGQRPLKGASRHLAHSDHAPTSKTWETAIVTFGYRVLGCTKELADRNNDAFLEASNDGSYNNARKSSKKRRAPARHQNQVVGITNPIACRFYVKHDGGEAKYPVLILPWYDITPAGWSGKLADTGFFGNAVGDRNRQEVPGLPKCYLYSKSHGRIVGIRGWASGYEDGGSKVWKREFPAMSPDEG
jgi:hypothetical protein